MLNVCVCVYVGVVVVLVDEEAMANVSKEFQFSSFHIQL